MAVNKNFVVKNGLEVGDTLIFASVADAKVGIGSTLPTIQLDVAGGIGATHINVSGVATITDSIRLGSGIAGTVFSALDNNLVGVGTSQPGFLLDVRSPGTGTTALYVQGDGKFTGDLNVNIGVFALNSNVTGFSTVNDIEINSDIYDIGGQTGTNQQVLISRGGSGAGVSWADLTTIPAGDATLLDGLDSTQFLRSDVADTKAGDTTFSNNAIFSSNVDIAGITTISGAIDGDSGANISGGETVLSSATVSDLTNNRVVIAGTSGALEDDANLTFDGSEFLVGTGVSLGIGTDSPSVPLEVADGIKVTNTSGSATVNIEAKNNQLSGVHFSDDAATLGKIEYFHTDNSLRITNNGSEHLSILSSGLIGIGTNNPSRLLHVSNSGGVNDCEIRIENTDGEGRQLTFFGSGSTARAIKHTGASAGNALAFTAGSDTHMLIDSSGNVGVGTASPGGKLEVKGGETILSSATVSDLTDNRIVIAGTSGALEDSADLTFDGSSLTVNDADVDITGTGGLSIDGSTVIDSSGVWQGSSAGIQGIQGITGTQGTNGTQGTTGAQGTAGSNGSNGSNGTQGIQGIQGRQGTAGSNGSNGSNGTQGIQGRQGTAGSNGSNGGTGAQGIQGRQGTTGATGSVTVSNNANNRVITATGGATANAEANLTFDGSNLVASGNITAYSDATVKDNIQTIEYALEKVLKLRGVEFDRNDLDGKPHQIGVIAQEIEKVIPEVVITNDDGLKSVAYGNLSGLLIEAIKELKVEIDELKSNQEG